MATLVLLFLINLHLRRVMWRGSTELHTLMELAATLLALTIGTLALVRYYSRKENSFLFVGTGFLGTGLLDGYHAVVTSSFFAAHFPSPPPSLIPWSWLASRLFLSVLLWLAWVFWKREDRLGVSGRIDEKWVYLGVGLSTLACFLLFVIAPLPKGYRSLALFHRPQELIPAFFFLLALVGYLRKGRWKSEAFEHWMVLSLLVGFMGQVMFMSTSSTLYDTMFDAAHLLKKLSYLCTLVGLVISMYHLFMQEESIVADRTRTLRREIAERQKAEQAAQDIAARYRTIFDTVQTGIVIIDPETHRILDANPEALRLAGRSHETVVGAECFQLICPAERGRCPVTDLGQSVDNSERVLLTAAGESRSIVKTVVPVLVSGRGHLLESFVDVSDRKQTEEILRKNEEKYRSLVSNIPDVVWTLNADLQFDFISPNIERISGFTLEDINREGARLYQECIHPDDALKVKEGLRALFTKGETYDIECRIRRKNGEWIWVHDRSIATYERNGQRYADGVLSDISVRKRAEEIVRTSEARFRALIENSSDTISLLDHDGVCIYAGPSTPRVFGYSESEVVGRSVFDFIHPDYVEAMQRVLTQAVGHPHTSLSGECLYLHKNGSWRWYEFIGQSLLDNPDIGAIVVNARDITEAHAADVRREESEHHFRTIFNAATDGIILHDVCGGFIDVNPRLCEMTGYTRDEILKLRLEDLSTGVPPYTAEGIALQLNRLMLSGEALTFEWHCKAKDGHMFWAEISARETVWSGQRRIVSTSRDITQRKRAEEALQMSDMKYRDLFESSRDAITILDVSSGRFVSGNPGAIKLFGAKDEAEFISHKPWDYSPGRQPDGRASVEKAHEMMERALRTGSYQFEWMHKRACDGMEFPADVLLTRVVRQGTTLIYGTVRDVTERKRAEAQITRMARSDTLTGLPNRRVFVDSLEQAIARARRSGIRFAVLYLDLDHFKDVNDTLGHPVGDLLLQAVAERLQASIREIDSVARFGGDEFAIILTDIKDPTDAAGVVDRILDATAIQHCASAAGDVANKILTAFSEPFVIQDYQIRSAASVGIAVYEPDSQDAETLLSHADVALYRAKSEGRGTYRFFTEAMDLEVRERVGLNTELREAIVSNQLFLLYQPQVDIESGRIVGLEALVRWHHPTRGTVVPSKFISEAERSGLIVPLQRWVLREVCRQIKQWLETGTPLPSIAVNLSGVQFKMPRELENDLSSILAEFELAPQLLELELTESVLMTASRGDSELLVRLRKRGHRIAIDDFGSGYSSLEYLRRYPADRIKIAQSFIAEIGIIPENDTIVRAALGLAGALGMEAVVEGVETAAQLALLRAWGCRIAQGYYFSRPLPVSAVTTLLRIGEINLARSHQVEIAALQSGLAEVVADWIPERIS